MSKLWLSNQVFSSELCEYQGGYCIDTKHLRRAYKQWNHANKTLNTSREELYRVDTITTLKRSLNQRLKLIEAIYALKKIAEQSSPKDSLGYLETFGVIRSSLLKNLLDVRNEIEHNDVEPPSYERCVELLDAIHGADLGQLGSHLGVVHRAQRILVLQLFGEQLEKVALGFGGLRGRSRGVLLQPGNDVGGGGGIDGAHDVGVRLSAY